ncbi:MAG: hypothetical protein E6344_05500 [Clostridium sp.]|nr:hypothetical protein [Clostridium sp.]MDU7083126.1 hypothetical protein [Clostridium sp.]
MSPKELLYVEDALGHEQQMKTACNDFASQIQDPELKNFVQGLAIKHETAFKKFYNLLNV